MCTASMIELDCWLSSETRGGSASVRAVGPTAVRAVGGPGTPAGSVTVLDDADPVVVVGGSVVVVVVAGTSVVVVVAGTSVVVVATGPVVVVAGGAGSKVS